jgi:hypothetical protein
MVDIAADDVSSGRARLNLKRTCRTLAILAFFRLLSRAAESDKRHEPSHCGPFTIGRSAIGGCDWLP